MDTPTFEIGSLTTELVTSRAGHVTLVLWNGLLDAEGLQRIDVFLGDGHPDGGLLLVVSAGAGVSPGGHETLVSAFRAHAPQHCAVVVEAEGVERRILTGLVHAVSITSRHPLTLCPSESAALVWLSRKLRRSLGSPAMVADALAEMRKMSERLQHKRVA